MDLLSKISQHKFCFGGAALSSAGGGYGFGDISPVKAFELLDLALSLGVKIFDTAPIYGFGQSEKTLGEYFGEYSKDKKGIRDQVFLVSKSGVSWHQATKSGSKPRVNMTNDPAVTSQMLEESLKRLQTDYIDLYMIHWPDEGVDIRYPLEVLKKAQEQGKIKHIGLCNTNLEDLEKAEEVCQIEVVQSEYNFFQRQSYESLKIYTRSNNISFMGWGSLDKGILSGRVNKDRSYEKSDSRSSAPWWKNQDLDKKIRVVQTLENLLQDYKLTLLQFSLGFINSSEDIFPLVGAKSQEQLNSAFEACATQLPLELQNKAQDIYQELWI